jgi:maltooligosyltrehalose trehalohydrolase
MSSVWAPFAEDVALLIGSEAWPMRRGADGWWHAVLEQSLVGRDYALQIDGQAYPDPRSPWQPYGVHGRSRMVDHASCHWTDARWQAPPLSSAIIYELHIGTFTPSGTSDSAIERLDHLVELGVTHVELMPVAEFLGDYGWGYDGVCPFAPHHAYGGPDGLKRLVNACHARGLAILLDVVYNHLGPSGNYLAKFGPYFTDRHQTPWGAAVNFDGPHSPEVRRYFCDNAAMWLRDYHFDGLRLDAVHAIVDTSAVPFFEQLTSEIQELGAHLGRNLVLIAESDLNDPRVVRSRETGGYGFDAQWSDDFHHALHCVLTPERDGYYADFGTLGDLATVMQRPYLYIGQPSRFRKRPHGRPPGDVSGHHFLAYTQTHDQVGNRARGERLAHLVSIDRLKIASTLALLSPYVPMLFQGEEWAASSPFLFFVDFADEPDLARAVASGRINEFADFGWNTVEIPDPTKRETFQRSKLRWDELTEPEHREMLSWYRSLIELRRSHPAFTSGRLNETTVVYDEDDQWLRVDRGPVIVACNLASMERQIPVTLDRHFDLWLTSKPGTQLAETQIVLSPESIAVIGPLRDLPAKQGLPQIQRKRGKRPHPQRASG